VTSATPASAIPPRASVTAVGVSPSRIHATVNAMTGTEGRGGLARPALAAMVDALGQAAAGKG
jgi:hypothetical protein